MTNKKKRTSAPFLKEEVEVRGCDMMLGILFPLHEDEDEDEDEDEALTLIAYCHNYRNPNVLCVQSTRPTAAYMQGKKVGHYERAQKPQIPKIKIRAFSQDERQKLKKLSQSLETEWESWEFWKFVPNNIKLGTPSSYNCEYSANYIRNNLD